MAQKQKTYVMDNLEPQERLKQLINYSNLVEVDPNVPPIRYYRSGFEMVRMANVYYEEGSLENAYVLYLKFMTLFLEKIRKHPGFNTVPIDVKTRNKAIVKEVLAKAEKLKQLLLEQYQSDYNSYLEELKQLQRKEQERKRQEQGQNVDKRRPPPTNRPCKTDVIANVPVPLDNIVYPDAESSTPSANFPPTAPPPPYVDIDSVPAVDRTNKPEINLHERYGVFRPVVVPVKVMTLFQTMAYSNTAKNIETCGILAGKLEKNELIITYMILPKQKGTSDSCVTMNEEEIFEIQDAHNLITLGWIHTHPTQTAFLSSVDLHTQCPYQLLMPEAIAIVCSPKYNNTGFFNLTPNYGLQYIAQCRKTGFHPHPTEPPLFMEAAHVRIENSAPLEVVDLRKE